MTVVFMLTHLGAPQTNRIRPSGGRSLPRTLPCAAKVEARGPCDGTFLHLGAAPGSPPRFPSLPRPPPRGREEARPFPRGPQWVGEVCPVQADAWLPLLPHTALLSPSIFRSIIVHSWVFFFLPTPSPEKSRSDSSRQSHLVSPGVGTRGHARGQIDKK